MYYYLVTLKLSVSSEIEKHIDFIVKASSKEDASFKVLIENAKDIDLDSKSILCKIKANEYLDQEPFSYLIERVLKLEQIKHQGLDAIIIPSDSLYYSCHPTYITALKWYYGEFCKDIPCLVESLNKEEALYDTYSQELEDTYTNQHLDILKAIENDEGILDSSGGYKAFIKYKLIPVEINNNNYMHYIKDNIMYLYTTETS